MLLPEPRHTSFLRFFQISCALLTASLLVAGVVMVAGMVFGPIAVVILVSTLVTALGVGFALVSKPLCVVSLIALVTFMIWAFADAVMLGLPLSLVRAISEWPLATVNRMQRTIAALLAQPARRPVSAIWRMTASRPVRLPMPVIFGVSAPRAPSDQLSELRRRAYRATTALSTTILAC
jgi:hypothetical protein